MNMYHKIVKTGVGLVVAALLLSSCKKDGNPNQLPSVSTADYEGKIDGYDNSDQVFSSNLVAYWSFDDSNNEKISGAAPTTAVNNSFATGGVRGKALQLAAGYLFFGRQFDKFKTDSLKSFSISSWVKILNNGTKRTMLFQLTRPGQFTGSLNFHLNTQSFPASRTDVLRVQPTFLTLNGGSQDNINNNLSPAIGMDKWTHIVLTYDNATGVFDIWMNAVKVGGFPNRGVGNNLFKANEPSEVIIGANYNAMGRTVSTDVSVAPMTGQIDEFRIWNTRLPDAFITALYNLGIAGK